MGEELKLERYNLPFMPACACLISHVAVFSPLRCLYASRSSFLPSFLPSSLTTSGLTVQGRRAMGSTGCCVSRTSGSNAFLGPFHHVLFSNFLHLPALFPAFLLLTDICACSGLAAGSSRVLVLLHLQLKQQHRQDHAHGRESLTDCVASMANGAWMHGAMRAGMCEEKLSTAARPCKGYRRRAPRIGCVCDDVRVVGCDVWIGLGYRSKYVQKTASFLVDEVVVVR
eukprot:761146-Hanusia_phi.AAC.1